MYEDWPSENIRIRLQNITIDKNLTSQLFPSEEAKSDLEKITKIFLYVLAMIMSIGGNGIIIVIIAKTKSLRTKFNIYIVNLSVADLLVVCLCMWVHLVKDLTSGWILGAFMCKVNSFMQVLVLSSSILTLTTTVVDRFLASFYPAYLSTTQKCQGGIILGIWIAAGLLALPWLLYMELADFGWLGGNLVCHANFPTWKAQKIYTTVFAVVAYALPVLTMFILLIATVRHSARYPQGRGCPTPALFASELLRRKAIHMTLTLLSVFVFCWSPQQIILMWDVYRDRTVEKPKGLLLFKYLALYLAYFTSAVYPIVFFIFNKCLRHSLKDFVSCRLRGGNSAVAITPEHEETPM